MCFLLESKAIVEHRVLRTPLRLFSLSRPACEKSWCGEPIWSYLGHRAGFGSLSSILCQLGLACVSSTDVLEAAERHNKGAWWVGDRLVKILGEVLGRKQRMTKCEHPHVTGQ